MKNVPYQLIFLPCANRIRFETNKKGGHAAFFIACFLENLPVLEYLVRSGQRFIQLVIAMHDRNKTCFKG